MWMSPLGKQVHKMSSLECIGRSKYGVTIFFSFYWTKCKYIVGNRGTLCSCVKLVALSTLYAFLHAIGNTASRINIEFQAPIVFFFFLFCFVFLLAGTMNFLLTLRGVNLHQICIDWIRWRELLNQQWLYWKSCSHCYCNFKTTR